MEEWLLKCGNGRARHRFRWFWLLEGAKSLLHDGQGHKVSRRVGACFCVCGVVCVGLVFSHGTGDGVTGRKVLEYDCIVWEGSGCEGRSGEVRHGLLRSSLPWSESGQNGLLRFNSRYRCLFLRSSSWRSIPPFNSRRNHHMLVSGGG